MLLGHGKVWVLNVEWIYKAVLNVDGASTRHVTLYVNGQGESGVLNVDRIYKAILNVDVASTRLY